MRDKRFVGPRRNLWKLLIAVPSVLLPTACFFLAEAGAQVLTASNGFSSARHFGPSVFGPENYFLVVGADITPSGNPTAATATQNGVTIPLLFRGDQFTPNKYLGGIAVDPGLLGAWTINATRGADTAVPILTNPIPFQELVPLALNVAITGTNTTPTLSWTVPNFGLLGTQVNTNLVTIFTPNQNKVAEFNLRGIRSSFAMPSGILQAGQSYVFDITFGYFDRANGLIDTSETYTQGLYTVASVPELETYVLMLGGLFTVSLVARRRKRASAEWPH